MEMEKNRKTRPYSKLKFLLTKRIILTAFTTCSHFHRSKILGLREVKAFAMVPQNCPVIKMLENGDFPLKLKQQFVKSGDLFLMSSLKTQKDSKLLCNDLAFKINSLNIHFFPIGFVSTTFLSFRCWFHIT